MKNFQLKATTCSILILFGLTIVFTSCEKNELVTNKEHTSDQKFDTQFKNYDIIEIDNEAVWNSVINQIDERTYLDMNKISSDEEVSDWSFEMLPVKVLADDFTTNLIGQNGKVSQIELPEFKMLKGLIKDNANSEVLIGIHELANS